MDTGSHAQTSSVKRSIRHLVRIRHCEENTEHVINIARKPWLNVPQCNPYRVGKKKETVR